MFMKPVAAGLARTAESVRLFAPNLCEGYAPGTVMASEAAGAQLMRDSPLRRVAAAFGRSRPHVWAVGGIASGNTPSPTKPRTMRRFRSMARSKAQMDFLCLVAAQHFFTTSDGQRPASATMRLSGSNRMLKYSSTTQNGKCPAFQKRATSAFSELAKR